MVSRIAQVAWLIVGFIVSLSGAIVVGRNWPSVTAHDLQTCIGRPCVYGILPGQTTWEQAQQTFSNIQFVEVNPNYISLQQSAQSDTEIFLSIDAINVGRIAITPTTRLPAGWLIERYGIPCGLSIYRQLGRFNKTVTLRYPTLLANIETADLQIDPFDSVVSILLLDPAYRPKYQPNICLDTVTDGARNFHWHGFASYSAYFTNPALRQE